MGLAYKLFRIKKGKLYPLYIHTDQEIPVGIHLRAQESEKTPNGKVKSKLGELAYRPGWHLTEIPLADHIGKRQPDGSLHQAADTVWCEVEYDDEIDYNPIVKSASTRKHDQCLRTVPANGYYWFQTNASAKVRWLITGGIRVKRILNDAEVATICRAHGMEPQPVEERSESMET